MQNIQWLLRSFIYIWNDICFKVQPHPHQPKQRDDNRQYKYEVPSLSSDNNKHNEYEESDEEALWKQEEAVMAELSLFPNAYAKYPSMPIRDELTVPVIIQKGGYAAIYHDNKQKYPTKEPCYQIYTLNDFKKDAKGSEVK